MNSIIIVIILICVSVLLGIGLSCLICFLEIKDTDIQRHSGRQGEKQVTKELRRIFSGQGYVIENPIYLDPHNMSHELDQVVVSRKGIFVIETKTLAGTVEGSQDSPTWILHYPEGGEREFTNPLRQNLVHMKVIRRLFNENLVLFGYIVMTNNNADEINCPQVINLIALEENMDLYPDVISAKDVRRLYHELTEKRSPITHEEHLENIRKHKEGLL